MGYPIKEIVKVIESIAPIDLAEEWDNVGILVGDKEASVHKIMVVLDITRDIIGEAVENQVGMIVSHHPLMFKPLRSVTTETNEGAHVLALLKSGIALYCAHTNLDKAPGGMDDSLAALLGFNDIKPLSSNDSLDPGFGRIGRLPEKVPMLEYLTAIQKKLNIESIDVIGTTDRMIQTIASCAGAGGDFIKQAEKRHADLYITGEVKYHEGVDRQHKAMTVASIGHYPSEVPGVAALINRLQNTLNALQYKLEVIPSVFQDNPFCRLRG